MSADFIVVLVTCPSTMEAGRLVDSLLNKRLIACGNIIPSVRSRFWWKGKVTGAKESLVVLKTKKRSFGSLEKELKRIHSYEVPEIIALPVVRGSREYLRWVAENSR